MVALAIDRSILAGLAEQIPGGSVLVTGTNGKGTTCRMLTAMMQAAGMRPILNREGSNQQTGLTTTLLAEAGLTGWLGAAGRAIGVLEVDEGSLPEILPQVSRSAAPTTLLVTNLFRDQMDRYLDLEAITSRWERALGWLPADAALVLNADDPRLAYLGADLPNPRVHYGLDDAGCCREADITSDFPRCPRCGGGLRYERIFSAHLGHWECGNCGLARPQPQVRAQKVDLLGPGLTRLQVTTPASDSVLEIPLPGLYNAYNTVAAVAGAIACQLPDSAIASVQNVTTGFFRMEHVRVDGRDVWLALAKNPNGYTEVLRAVLGDGQPRHLLLGLNDRPGNQQPDISWIWDIDFESLRGLVPAAVLCGNRCADLAVRLKYAGWLGDGSAAVPATPAVSAAAASQATSIAIEPDPVAALRLALDRTPVGEPIWVVSTYLVLWQLRGWLRRRGYVGPLWAR
jgi:UDP-N-acetylmuramyl tripeptide synthase